MALHRPRTVGGTAFADSGFHAHARVEHEVKGWRGI